MKIHINIIALLLILNCVPSKASDWTPIGEAAESYQYVDKQSVGRSGRYRKAWFLFNQKSEKSLSQYPSQKYKSVKYLYYFLCGDRSISTIQAIYYSEDYGGGITVNSWSTQPELAKFEEIAPDTTGETMHQYVCVTSVYDQKRVSDDELGVNNKPRLSPKELAARVKGKVPPSITEEEAKRRGYITK